MATTPDLWDRSKRRAWLRARRFADLIIGEPDLRAETARWIELHWNADPSARDSLLRWRALLARQPREIAGLLMAHDDAGELLRDTIPPVRPIPAGERARMLKDLA